MNTEKFTGKASIYEKYRPQYPTEFLNYLYDEMEFSAKSLIADIGSGTGILSKQLLDRGSRVIGVEPNDNMRQAAEKALTNYQGYISVNGSAEKTTLMDNSVDFITVAQAFHWFDAAGFRTECRRILKPGGRVVLVWNSRVTNSELVIQNGHICEKLCLNFKGFSGGQEENPETFSDFFEAGVCDYRTFDNNQVFDKDSFIGRNLSASYAPAETDSNYRLFVEELSELFLKHSVDGKLTMPNITRSYTGKV
jgi:SAM-dependent methyltransferase